MKKILIIACLAIATITAQGQTKTTVDYDKMAVELCDCMDDFLSIMEEVKMAQEKGDTEIIDKLSAKIFAVSQDLEKCMGRLEKKHGKIKGAKAEDKAEAALRKNCPRYARVAEQNY